MHFALKTLCMLVAGIALGLLLTWIAVVHGDIPGDVKDGPWHTSTEVGSSKGGLYTRAAVALHGLLALKKSETLYYTTTTDSDGSPLHGACAYHLSGHDPDARWWSITAYGSDDYLIPNPAHRYSVSMNIIHRKPDGSFEVEISPRPGADNWIPVVSGPFTLILRLYNPGEDTAADPKRARLPALHRWSCT